MNHERRSHQEQDQVQSQPPIESNAPTSASASSNQGLGLKDQNSSSSNTFYSSDSGGISSQDEQHREREVDAGHDKDKEGDRAHDAIADAGNLPNRDSSSSIESSFVPSRPRNQVSSILPPAAFFAPKRKQQSQSPTWQLPSLPPSSNNTSTLPACTTPDPQDSLSLSRSGSASRSKQRPSSRSSHHLQSNSSSHSPGFSSINLPNETSYSPRPNSPWGVASTIQSGKRDSQEDLATTNLNPEALQSYYKQGSLKANKHSREPLLDVDHLHSPSHDEEADGSLRSPNPIGPKRSKNQTRFSTQLSQSNSRQRGSSIRNSSQEPRKRDSTSSQASKPPVQSLPGHHLTRERNYSKFEGSNRFFLFGLVMTSSDNPLPFLASLALLLILGGLFFGFVAPFIWREVSIAPVIIFAYTWLVATVNMVVTAWRDPGVLPRNLDPDPPCSIGESRALDPEDPLAVPLPRMIRIRETDVKVKWCETCGTYRAPRSSHCRVCDNCVENIDHHCTFLNTCIGRRNYFAFFSFLVFCLISASLCIAFCVLHLYYLARPTDYELPRSGFGRGYSASEAMNHAPVSVLLIALAVVTLFPLMTLFGYHIRLIFLNLTTVEQIRISTTKSYDSPSHSSHDSDSRPPTCCGTILGGPSLSNHPFGNTSTLKNVSAVLARPTTLSSIERYGFWLEDRRRDNPGLRSTSSSNRASQLDNNRSGPDKGSDRDNVREHETHIDMNGDIREKEMEQKETSVVN